MKYLPPYQITPEIVTLISIICEKLGRFSVTNQEGITPLLRRSNRLRTIQASLAIENNSLSLEQVTAIISGKRILGNPKEIQEVKNAFSAYEMLDTLSPIDERDLLKAHETLMMSLVNNPGHYCSSDVGVIKGKEVVHLAPPAERVPTLMHDLLAWLKSTDIHPLLASSIFHYEFEFIHPFLDGNGRMGRLWQTLILSKWKSILAFLPVETVVRNRQEEYYLVLGKSDQQGESTTFIAFMLHAIYDAFSYLHPALNNKFIEMTISNKPCSRLQKYIITPKGLKTRQYD